MELQQLAGGTAELSKAATADSRLRAELERAKEELQEAVMEGNSKYNSMIAERLQVRAALCSGRAKGDPCF